MFLVVYMKHDVLIGLNWLKILKIILNQSKKPQTDLGGEQSFV